MPHNEFLHPSCNIDKYSHILFTKAPRSKLQECLGKLIPPLDFLHLHPIVILFWNEWFGWIHTIWVCNGKTSFLSFCGLILPQPSPIILLLHSFHLYRDLFIQSNELFPPLHVALCWYIVRTKCYKDLPLVTCRMNY